jgi:hypothetical protein
MTATPRPPTRASLASFGIAAVAALAGLAGWQAAKAPASGRTASVLAGVAPSAPAQGNMLRYDAEYPTIPYNTAPRADAVADLIQRVERGEVVLNHHPVRGYLESLLEELDISPASQTLVYSQTSLQSTLIRPAKPRAIYFNDEVYVAFVQSGPLEIASVDPQLGPVFYLLDRSDTKPAFSAELGRCMACHDSYSLTGGGAPRFIVGSGYTGPTGALVSHEGWILISDRTPLKSRWGGWYVTGQHGDQVHLGNMQIKSFADFERLEELRLGNLETLDDLFDVEPYLTNKSDIVALLVLQHQADVQNLITRLSYDARSPAENQAELVAETIDRLLRMMLFAGAVEYTAPIAGDPAFAAQFASRAVRDAQGRSLRDFDLNRRLFRYPLSYLIYSRAFDALPTDAKGNFYARLDAVLTGADSSEDFTHLTAEDRSTIRSILRATKPDFAASVAN